MSPPGPLTGRTIIVTRPRAQSAHLAEAIAEAGGTPLIFPPVSYTHLTLPTSDLV